WWPVLAFWWHGSCIRNLANVFFPIVAVWSLYIFSVRNVE
uniref:Uncharacterized protein n=1 Tax=Aegilops tauschii subsp. strangulata TaxID=200361 RepID=A0A453QTY3_AEGTS